MPRAYFTFPPTHPRFWAREAYISAEDGQPGAAAYAMTRYITEHPEADCKLVRERIARWMQEAGLV